MTERLQNEVLPNALIQKNGWQPYMPAPAKNWKHEIDQLVTKKDADLLLAVAKKESVSINILNSIKTARKELPDEC